MSHKDLKIQRKFLYFPKKFLYFYFDSCFHATVQTFRLCYTVTCNNPGHEIERSRTFLFSVKHISDG